MSTFGANIFWNATTYFQLLFKVDNFVPPIFLLPRSVAKIEWNKHPYYFFPLLVKK